jgi:hypothetical protein
VPQHRIDMTQPSKHVVNSDVRFDIHSNREKLGTLTISKGSIDWWPRSKQSGKKISWERFAKVMDELAGG